MKNAGMNQLVSICLVCMAALLATVAAGDTIMYQGVLSRPDATAVEDGLYNMDFTVYDAPEGGMPLWEETGLSVAVIQGAFAVELGLVTPDLITLFQDGEPRWLEVAVDLGEGVQIFDPRVPFTMTPYAAYAATLQGLTRGELDDVLAQKADIDDVYTQTDVDAALALKADADDVDAALALKADTDAVWLLGGNQSAAPLVLGCTDGFALELVVNNERALRIEPGATPNIVGGFSRNQAAAGALGATISGGGLDTAVNRVTDNYGTIGGGGNNQAGNDDGDPESREYATVGGGLGNIASGARATIGGGSGNDATADYATVAGGLGNTANTIHATVGGGQTNTADGSHATVGGGLNNTTGHDWTTIGGGEGNTAEGSHAIVGGGYGNYAGGSYAIIGGGQNNTAINNWATVGGGEANIAEGSHATVGGGYGNQATSKYATVGGGYGNQATSEYATVGGGQNNTASIAYATIGGGGGNEANGFMATVPGGRMNEANGNTSFAAGNQAKATHAGAFVWGDSTYADVTSSAVDEFTARASGGVRFYSDSGLATGVELAAGSGTWSSVSDRALKENLAPVNGLEVLERVAALPIATWNYKTQDATIRHMGPMAQDLYAAFGLGENDTRISGIDADGIALAAIQGLHQRLADKDREIEALRADKTREIKALRMELDSIKSLLLSGADE